MRCAGEGGAPRLLAVERAARRLPRRGAAGGNPGGHPGHSARARLRSVCGALAAQRHRARGAGLRVRPLRCSTRPTAASRMWSCMPHMHSSHACHPPPHEPAEAPPRSAVIANLAYERHLRIGETAVAACSVPPRPRRSSLAHRTMAACLGAKAACASPQRLRCAG